MKINSLNANWKIIEITLMGEMGEEVELSIIAMQS
jgi:hypothetical protein